ncbi:hypothetical protein [Acidithiobacillus thiooxidans]|jgi:hypothetical protein|uniref:Uncharacterized protein n=1 Tax=Acidithiobacillus thiooxidans ATCC 19377 TaxID=637390 RepID=A0A543Q2A9_ACITH|nr:hypothetical protein [Acidithiobacillus thiooxidans]MBU2750573.1 hypothetical protein [Acidithiobacillus thiooxidans]MBU2836269.1 hypothetical protein [Acidithiobacillus thiooxidans]MDX5935433.1 hypothetical protein [Acidithiobacillus thiooxidans]TQN50428.1 hypothetical protein DLNHIDIE_00281 [Acidithiobacillus thiooxidans ATCC 19377]
MNREYVVTNREGGLLFGLNGTTRLSGQMARFETRKEAEIAMERFNSIWGEREGFFTDIEEVEA